MPPFAGPLRRGLWMLLSVLIVLACGIRPEAPALPVFGQNDEAAVSVLPPLPPPPSSPLSSALSAPSESFDSSEAPDSSAVSASSTPAAASSARSAAAAKPAQTSSTPPGGMHVEGEVKAVWLSQYDLESVFCEKGRQRSEASFTSLFAQIAAQIRACGLNTVFLQSRPYSDSFYPSAYYPWSKFITGAYGVSAAYDPYAIMVRLLRAQGLSVHGWINPLRAMKEKEIEDVPEGYPIKQWYRDPQKRKQNLVLSEGRWYYNAASTEVRTLITAGARELLQRYGLDGIHIDDYFFYSPDAASISAMVRELYRTVKSVNPNAWFGVSPDGNLRRDAEVHLADVATWCSQPGYVDYICPQLYYGFEHSTQPFAKVLQTWNGLITSSSGVRLLVGLTLSKSGLEDTYAGAGKTEWVRRSDILVRSLREARLQSRYLGVSVFSFQHFYQPGTAQRNARAKAEADGLIAALAQ